MQRRHYLAAFFVLFALALPVILSTVPEARAVRVGEYFTCKYIDSTGRWEKKTSQFETTDVGAYVYWELVDCVIGETYNVQITFYNPANAAISSKTGSARANGNTQKWQSMMEIIGRTPEKQPGPYYADLYYQWVGGPVTFGFKVEFTVGPIAASGFTITVDANPSKAPITIDGASYGEGSIPKTFSWEKGSTHTLLAKDKFSDKQGVQYVFVSWSDGSTALSRTVTVNAPMTYTANYKTQYYLTVESDYGSVEGEGWYDDGTNAYATLDVDKVSADMLNDYIFKDWKTDARGTKLKSNAIKMDGPKKAEANWTKQFSTMFYALIGAVVTVAAVVGFLMFKRSAGKKAPPPPPVYRAPPPAPTPSAPTPASK